MVAFTPKVLAPAKLSGAYFSEGFTIPLRRFSVLIDLSKVSSRPLNSPSPQATLAAYVTVNAVLSSITRCTFCVHGAAVHSCRTSTSPKYGPDVGNNVRPEDPHSVAPKNLRHLHLLAQSQHESPRDRPTAASEPGRYLGHRLARGRCAAFPRCRGDGRASASPVALEAGSTVAHTSRRACDRIPRARERTRDGRRVRLRDRSQRLRDRAPPRTPVTLE